MKGDDHAEILGTFKNNYRTQMESNHALFPLWTL